MIIDADCHVSANPDGFAIGADELVALMDKNDVDKAIAWPMVSYTRAIAPDNAAIFESAKRFPDRIIPFGGVNPRLGVQEAIDEVKRCRDFGFHGVKLNGGRDGYLIDDPKLSLPVVEKIVASGMVLAFHSGANDYVRTHPYRIAKIAAAFPETPIIMVHMGGVREPHLHQEAIEFAMQHDNILLGDSKAVPGWPRRAIAALGAHRVCYASDTPFQNMAYPLAMHKVELSDLAEEDRALVMGGNIQKLLNL